MASERKKRLKVIGVNTFTKHWSGQHRCIAAVHSQAEFAALIGSSTKYVADYAAETGNDKELEVALAKPHMLFYQPDRYKDEYLQV